MVKNNMASSAEGLEEYVFNKYLKNIKNNIIADLGCGYGNITKKIKKINKIFSIDINKYKDDINYIISDLNKDFPIGDNLLDIILSVELIEHLENPRHFLRQCKRCLKDNGTIIITTPNLTHFKARIKFLLKGVLYGFDDLEYEVSHHIRPVFIKDFYRMSEEIGLSVLEVDKYKDISIIVMGNCTQKKQQ